MYSDQTHEALVELQWTPLFINFLDVLKTSVNQKKQSISSCSPQSKHVQIGGETSIELSASAKGERLLFVLPQCMRLRNNHHRNGHDPARSLPLFPLLRRVFDRERDMREDQSQRLDLTSHKLYCPRLVWMRQSVYWKLAEDTDAWLNSQRRR